MAQHATRSRSSIAVLLHCLLAFALMAPTTLLFARVWGSVGERARFAQSERNGIQYIRSLGQLTIALTDAQSAAVSGRPFPRDTITRVVEATASVDARIGGDLRTHERWSGLRAKIEALAALSVVDPATAFSTFGEATDMLLALYKEVRDNSQLTREQDVDASYLQEGAAQQLPEAVVAAGRFMDLAVIAAGRPRNDPAGTAANLLNARDAVTYPANDLAAGLQAAVDGTSSRTLSGNLLSRLDRFRRGMETLTATTVPVDGRTAVNTAALRDVRNEVQTAASELAATILDELDLLIGARIEDLDRQRRTAAVTLAVGVLLALIPLAVRLVRPRRRPVTDPPVPLPSLPAEDVVPTWRREPTGAR
ncbi:hypothetical protein AB0K00_22420 [Dactylosporangium sp. NPDC049525]|uniref:hypothetical protein n=1 Tax=Dactylosporangium sp. NPDC049525 TaxID=3154730 RepID=UPI0034161F20